jgi:hypothetical protein
VASFLRKFLNTIQKRKERRERSSSLFCRAKIVIWLQGSQISIGRSKLSHVVSEDDSEQALPFSGLPPASKD